MEKRIAVSFSGGKDSTLALHRIIQSHDRKVDCLFTTVTENYQRTSMHGVRESLLEQQAQAMQIPLRKITIPSTCTNEIYESIMGDAIQKLVDDGVTHMMFGDIHLKDVKEYRENMLSRTPIKPIFPIWGEKTDDLMDEFLNLGYKTVSTCVDSKQLDPAFVGRVIDDQFIKDLPNDVDPCGENGEFHTFVFDGPLFQKPIHFSVSDERTVRKDLFTGEDRFYYVDLRPE
ncbi:Dph6-related ATP pyrophosphatase [Salinibacillus xinjiangensis]|uniref:Diphthine--ammonia ligase n=1 Tax=Salinibacillus xinjiangensis TaxID=1229268 RepID=A0A6G1X404_9BACI|nr:diphthine--ammonia ligase [Salinibacillus xinjiangensis]MRG85723.1 diphthine--ammonia ligase [Salinibacillus xinjiangensis]